MVSNWLERPPPLQGLHQARSLPLTQLVALWTSGTSDAAGTAPAVMMPLEAASSAFISVGIRGEEQNQPGLFLPFIPTQL